MFTADFETTTDKNDCRVWAWAVCEIGVIDNIVTVSYTHLTLPTTSRV